ncbi:MAG TPA: hypothetical protein PKE29_17095 [Phycisphaerales bacterium]|nr:hypothetical protein [Phycisphaerales bacterium]
MAGIALVSAVTSSAASSFIRNPPANQKTAQNPIAASQSEANETIAVTRAEAAKGDQTAIRKLASLQRAEQARQTAQAGSASKSAAKTDNDGDHDGGAKEADAATNSAASRSATTSTNHLDTQA